MLPILGQHELIPLAFGCLHMLLRRPQVEQLTGLATSSLYNAMRHHGFPRPVRLTPDTVAWKLSDLRRWMASLPEADIGNGNDRAA